METRKRRTRNKSSEEEIKPKRVRGSRVSDSKAVVVVENIKTTPVRSRIKPLPLEQHDYDSTLRLQNYPDFHSLLDNKSLVNLIGACYSATQEKVKRMIQDPRVTIGELQAIVLSTDAIDSDSNSRLRSKEYSDTRLFGKPTDKVEITGAGGGAVKVEATAQKLNIDEMSDEDLEKLESVMEMLMAKEAEEAKKADETTEDK